ncbi:MAG: DEAD/DEAH box helicase family protein [Clostridiales bacterium]|nr:DEAD/DEAH box helicase family protein [Clostridiales bacterium]
MADRTNFIKEKYGTGGQSNALSGVDDSWADYDSKGLRLSKNGIRNPETEILLPWKKVAQRIDFLIENGRFLSVADYDHMASYERRTMAAKILSFYGGMPPEIPRPFAYQQDQVLAYGGSLEDLTEALEDREKMRTILKAMDEALAALSLDDYRYEERSGILADMRGYVDGSYTLFSNKNERKEPLLENQQLTLFDFMGAGAFEPVTGDQKEAESANEKTVEQHDDLVDADAIEEKQQEAESPETEPPETLPQTPTIRDLYEHYLPIVETAVLKNRAYQNACRNSDRENAEIEGNTAIKRAVLSLADMELYRLYFDETGFHNRLHKEVIETTYPMLSAPAPAESFTVWQLSETAAKEYDTIKERYQSTLVGFEQHGYFEFYGDDARLVSQIIRSQIFEKPAGEDTRLFTAFPVSQWAAFSEMIRKKGESLALMSERPNGTHRLTKYFSWKDYLPLDAVIHVDGREFRIDTVDYQTGIVSLQDMTMVKEARYPIFRSESVEFVRSYYEEEEPIYDFSTEMRVTDALEQNSVNHDDFSGEQMDVIYNAAQKELDIVPLADPDFSPEQMQLIADAEERLQDDSSGISADLIESLSEDAMTQEEVEAAREKYQLPLNADEAERIRPRDKTKDAGDVEETTDGPENVRLKSIVLELNPAEGEVEPVSSEGLEQTAEEQHEKETEIRTEIETDTEIETETETETESETEKEVESDSEPQPQERINFRISDDDLGAGGQKTKFRANMNAIHLLKKLETENRLATAEGQEVLSRYVGWGGIPQAFDERAEGWSGEYQELRSVLTEDKYKEARASTLNAFYTSPTVIKAMYEALERMGLRSGNILEPSCGVGNFMGLIPESMENARMYGVELDSVSGRIAQQLYQKNTISVQGFETTQYPDNFFDCVIGNVPFGSYKVADKRYDRQNFLIHDYFIAKSIDLVRPGGVIAVITSSGTMDKVNSSVREYIGNRADLLGAVRLPKNAFLRNANTGVVADILFLQKRDRASIEHPSWVELGTTPEGYMVNSYFVQHPEMVLGEFTTESTQYGRQEVTVKPIEGAELSLQLHEAISHISGQITEYEPVDDELVEDTTMIPADPAVKNFSFTARDGEVYYRENSQMRKMTLSKDMKARVLGMVGLRDTVRELIDCQLNDGSDEEVEKLQQRLESQYDSFTSQYGLINSRSNKRAFSNDNSYSLLASLEMLDEDGNLERKADIFTRRTIRRAEPVSHVDTASDALALSIGEKAKVDLPYMAELLGTPGEYGKIIQDLQGVIFRDPAEEVQEDETAGWHTADDYLSGNVRKKLEAAKAAAAHDGKYAVNVEYLEKVQPKDLDASEIEVRLGATWVKQEYIQEFMEEMFRPPWRMRDHIKVLYSKHTGQWQITGKSFDKYNVRTNSTYGTKRANGYRLLEDALNLRDTKIYDTVTDDNGKEKRVLNQNETTLAQQKQELLKDEFKDWIFRDMGRREDICRTYNTLFNSIRPREYDGSHIQFVGMNPEITMMEHQRNAVAHILYGNNTLLAHCVGAGKTFEMTAAAMESIRLGLARKCLFVVPNHLTQQWGSDFLRLYPGANVLVATKKDFEPANRKKFCSRIATGQYDAIIIGHSQFERIPLSVERQAASIERQIDDIMLALSDADASGLGKRSFTVKQLEKTKRSLEAKLAKLNDQSRKDDVVTFEQLGVDKLFVDESHYYKNLFLYTKMNNVAGIAQTDAQKSSDMFMKCQYMDEITGGKGVTFATGTPVSNTMSELYTIMRYLQYDTLQEMGLGNFDAWAASFGETITSIELSPEGTGYRAKTRFARFYNLPELISVFRECADVQTADMLNLPVPESEFIDEKLQPSEIQKEMVETFSKRADLVRNGSVDSSVDNMLRITTDGRKLALDQRLLNDMLPDDENSKVNRCVDNIYRIWKETEEKRLTQLVFSDLSTPKKDGSFNVYDDLRNKLIVKGVPPEEIAFIHNADTEVKKEELFKKVRTGQVRILVGSTAKMGAGTNVQDRLIALHHLDVPWKPSDLEQREGRILRQGNQNKKVKIYRYVTEGTFDAFSWQTLETKQKFISQIMTSKSPVRSAEDVDDTALTYAEIKALATSNPYIKEKMSLDVDVSKLKLLKANYKSQFYQLESDVAKKYPGEIKATEQYIAGMKSDAEAVAAIPALDKEHFSMTVNGTVYTEYKEAGEAIISAAIAMRAAGVDGVIGEYHGFSMQAGFVMLTQKFTLILQKSGGRHYVELGKDPTGNITRINHALTSIGEKLLPEAEQKLENLRQQMQNAQEELKKPFPKEQELTEKSARLAELNALLNMDKKDSMDAVGVGEKATPAEPVSSGGRNQPASVGDILGRDETGQSCGWQSNQGSQRWQGNPNSQSNPNTQNSQNSQNSPNRQNVAQSRFRSTKPKMYPYR